MNETGRVIAPRGLHLRQHPDRDSQVLYTLRFDAIVKIEDTVGGWYKVRTAWGERGFLAKEWVRVVPAGPAPPDVELPPLPDVKVRPLFRTWTEAAVSAVIIFGLMVLLAWCSARAAAAQPGCCMNMHYEPLDPSVPWESRQIEENKATANRRSRYEKKWGKGVTSSYSDQTLKRIEKNHGDPDCWQYTPKHCY